MGIFRYFIIYSRLFINLYKISKNFENNGRNIKDSIVKIKLEKTSNLCWILIWSTHVQRKQISDKFVINLPNETDTVTQLLVSLEYYNFNLYLAITRLIHEERFVCDHEIIKVKQIAETMYAMKCKKWRTWSLCVVNM